VPGFLLLDGTKQFRIEGPLSKGGAATVFRGIFLDQELIKQYSTVGIALKKIERNDLLFFSPSTISSSSLLFVSLAHPKLSAQENKESFLQEVSIMWSCSFHQNVVKLVGYTVEPVCYIATKLYELDLFTLIHHPDEPIQPVLALKLAG